MMKMNTRMLAGGITLCTVLLLSLGCSAPPPAELSKVEDGQSYKRGDRIAFKGVAVTTTMGEHRWRHRGGNSFVPDPKKPHPQAMWVVPVTNPGESTPKVVQMWVAAPHAWTKLHQKPGPWLAKLKTDFDGKRVEGKVLGSAGGPATWTTDSPSWEKAIQEVTERTGLQTPPDAAVFMWPPKGVLPHSKE